MLLQNPKKCEKFFGQNFTMVIIGAENWGEGSSKGLIAPKQNLSQLVEKLVKKVKLKIWIFEGSLKWGYFKGKSCQNNVKVSNRDKSTPRIGANQVNLVERAK